MLNTAYHTGAGHPRQTHPRPLSSPGPVRSHLREGAAACGLGSTRLAPLHLHKTLGSLASPARSGRQGAGPLGSSRNLHTHPRPRHTPRLVGSGPGARPTRAPHARPHPASTRLAPARSAQCRAAQPSSKQIGSGSGSGSLLAGSAAAGGRERERGVRNRAKEAGLRGLGAEPGLAESRRVDEH